MQVCLQHQTEHGSLACIATNGHMATPVWLRITATLQVPVRSRPLLHADDDLPVIGIRAAFWVR